MIFLQTKQILIIDDEPCLRRLMGNIVRSMGYEPVEAGSVAEAKKYLTDDDFTAVLLDIFLPDSDGFVLLREFCHSLPLTPFIVLSGHSDMDLPVKALRLGAQGYLIKPFSVQALRAELVRVLNTRSALLNERLEHTALQEALAQRTRELLKETGHSFAFQRSLVTALCRLAEVRNQETGDHLNRIAGYCRIIAMAMAKMPQFSQEIDELFVRRLLLVAPLHDIGKAGIPDSVLMKPGRLTPEEFEVMKGHTTIGRDILRSALSNLDEESSPLLQLGMDICAYHHEKWDGSGYPNGLRGEAIPLAARIVAVADVYDAMSSPRVYRNSVLPHSELINMIQGLAGTHFDPAVVEAVTTVQDQIANVRTQSTPLPIIAEALPSA